VLLGVAAILIGSLYIALSVTLTGAFYSRDPVAAATSPLSRPISRVMMAQLCLKTVLTVCFILLYSFDSMHWFLLVLLAVGTSVLAYLYTCHLPYYRFEFNVMRACTFWVLTWASLCMIVTELSGDVPEQSRGASILFFFGTPFVAIAAAMATQFRKLSIIRRGFNALESPTDIELKVRFLLEHVTELRSQRAMGLTHSSSTVSKSSSQKGASKSGEAASKSHQGNSETSIDDSARSVHRRLENLEEERRLLEETSLLEEVCGSVQPLELFSVYSIPSLS
jgi:hypothetical protein